MRMTGLTIVIVAAGFLFSVVTSYTLSKIIFSLFVYFWFYFIMPGAARRPALEQGSRSSCIRMDRLTRKP